MRREDALLLPKYRSQTKPSLTICEMGQKNVFWKFPTVLTNFAEIWNLDVSVQKVTGLRILETGEPNPGGHFRHLTWRFRGDVGHVTFDYASSN